MPICRIALIAGTIFALVVEVTSAIGWLAWDRTARRLADDPGAGAVDMAEDGLLGFPSAVMRGRRLVGFHLAGAETALIAASLSVLAERQVRWLPADADGFLNRARVAVLEDDLDAARGHLDQALLRDPTRPFSLRMAALLARYRGAFEVSLDLLAQAEAVAPGFRQPVVELTADDEEWLRLEGLRRRLQAYPRIRVPTLISLAQTLRSSGRVDDGWATLEEGAGDPRADLVRTRWQLEDGDMEAAAVLARSIAEQSRLPADIRAGAWALLARALEETGNSQGALQAAGEALSLDPENAAPYRALARIAVSQGDFDKAMQYLRTAWGMEPTNQGVLSELARAAEMAGKPAEARLVLERAFEIAPEDPLPAIRLVDFLFRQGDYMDAAMTLSTALDHHPANAELLKRAEKLSRDVSGR